MPVTDIYSLWTSWGSIQTLKHTKLEEFSVFSICLFSGSLFTLFQIDCLSTFWKLNSSYLEFGFYHIQSLFFQLVFKNSSVWRTIFSINIEISYFKNIQGYAFSILIKYQPNSVIFYSSNFLSKPYKISQYF
jgi:hypothetical protein